MLCSILGTQPRAANKVGVNCPSCNTSIPKQGGDCKLQGRQGTSIRTGTQAASTSSHPRHTPRALPITASSSAVHNDSTHARVSSKPFAEGAFRKVVKGGVGRFHARQFTSESSTHARGCGRQQAALMCVMRAMIASFSRHEREQLARVGHRRVL